MADDGNNQAITSAVASANQVLAQVASAVSKLVTNSNQMLQSMGQLTTAVSGLTFTTSGLGTWSVLATSAVATPHTGDTNETVLATINLAANTLGANGLLRVNALYTMTNNGNNKIMRVRLGGLSGAAFTAITVTTVADYVLWSWIQNRNAVNSQVGKESGQGSYGSGTGSVSTGSINTSSAQTLVITGQLGNSADTIQLEAYIVELLAKQ
jgi:hypothetical protein